MNSENSETGKGTGDIPPEETAGEETASRQTAAEIPAPEEIDIAEVEGGETPVEEAPIEDTAPEETVKEQIIVEAAPPRRGGAARFDVSGIVNVSDFSCWSFFNTED